MRQRAFALVLLAFLGACGQNQPESIADPIPDTPENQQRTVGRSEFRWQWPFTVGTGTLGCTSGAVVFRTAGVSYALNDAARSRGFASIEPIRQIGSSGPPRDPLARLPQDQRMQIFAQSAACARKFADNSVETNRCKQRLRESRSLSEADLTQIEAEGLERLWRPLSPKPIGMDPLIDAGLKLCQR
jgi:uncharacterized protein DUF2511